MAGLTWLHGQTNCCIIVLAGMTDWGQTACSISVVLHVASEVPAHGFGSCTVRQQAASYNMMQDTG
jgi:hypothetical protein